MSPVLPVFDHLTLNARDELAPCCAALEAMGFMLTAPSYSNIGAVNRCIVLDGAYLETIAINPKALPPRKELLQQPLGLNAIVFRTNNADACLADLKAKGIPALPVQPFSRMAENSRGEEREVSFRVVRLEPTWAAQAFPFGRVYFCQHLNADVVFDPGFVRHANGCRSFAQITIEVKNLTALSVTMSLMFPGAWALETGPDSVRAQAHDGMQATLRTQALNIRFLQGSEDRIRACGFQSSAVHPPDSPQVFETPYGRFTL